MIGEAKLSGKIDKIQVKDSIAHVIDFKTGKPVTSWEPRDAYDKVKLHNYANQLIFYKLLIENSASYSKKLVVNSGALEFIEPGENGQLVDDLKLVMRPEDIAHFSSLIRAVWQHIINLDFPDVTGYKKDLSGVVAFEQYLIDSTK